MAKRNNSVPKFVVQNTLSGLQFYSKVQNLIDYNRPLRCIPNITLIAEENSAGYSVINKTALFDYSDCAGEENLEFLGSIIAGLTAGDSITMERGEHFDQSTDETSDLSGSYTFDQLINKTILVANVQSIVAGQSYDKLYKGKDFYNSPVVLFGACGDRLENQRIVIKNVFGRYTNPSFSNMGTSVNDYLQFTDGLNADVLFKVTGISYDNNDHELVTVTGGSTWGLEYYSGITPDNRFLIPTSTRLYRQYANTSEQQISTTQTYSEPVNNLQFYSAPDNYGKNAYAIAGSYRPTLRLTVGNMYIFNYSSIKASGLLTGTNLARISSVPDGTHSGGSSYLKGITIYDNAMIFVPQQEGTYYYYSPVVSGMGGKIIIMSDGPSIYTLPAVALNNASNNLVSGTNTFIY